MTPLLLVVIQTTRPERRDLTAVLSAVLAAFALSKFTTFLIASLIIVIVAIIDVSKHRRAPLPLIVFLASFALLYHWAGQDFSNLIPYIAGALEFSSGYSRAMQIKGPWTEIVAFAGVSSVLVLSFMAMEFRHARIQREYLAPAGLVAALLLSLFIVFKAAFVRHDGHALLGWGGLVLASAFLVGRAKFTSGKLGAAALVCIGLASSTATVLSHRYYDANDQLWPFSAFTGTDVVSRVDAATASLFDWPARLRVLNEQREAALAKIRSEYPIGPVEGSVDLFTYNQGILLAHGLDYKPSPIFQSYAAYTPYLIDRNRRAFQDDGRPRNMLVMPSTIDGRFPALESGALWPTLMQHYDAVDLRSGFAMLRERQTPRPVALSPIAEISTTFDTRLELPDGDWPLWIKIDLKRNLAGKLITTAYKEPLVFIHAEFGSAGWRTWRLIPSMSADGFLLSPVVESTAEFVSVFSQPDNLKRLSHKKPTAIKFTTTNLGAQFFEKKIRVELHRLEASADPKTGAFESIFSELERQELAFESQKALRILASSWMNSTPIAPEIRGGNLLFAHAPMELSMPIDATRAENTLKVRFGMFDGTWSEGGNTDGVCFEVWAETASGKQDQLWRRCLNPVQVEADRGEQSASIAVPRQSVAKLRFVTDAGPTNAWDWSYWSKINVVPQ